MHVPQRRTRQHHAVGMERHGRDGRGAAVVQEAGVGLDAVQEGAVDVEEIDVVTFGAAVWGVKGISVMVVWDLEGKRWGKGTYVANTGACSCTLNVRKVSFVARIVCSGLSFRISHSLTSPFLLPLISSLKPPLCICTFVIHCLCSRQTLTIASAGFSR